jgi:hypothetical protein
MNGSSRSHGHYSHHLRQRDSVIADEMDDVTVKGLHRIG